MNRSTWLLPSLLASSLISSGQVRAGFMNWSYSTNAVPPGFSVNKPGNNGGGTFN
jgi:hypothetical protein